MGDDNGASIFGLGLLIGILGTLLTIYLVNHLTWTV